MLTREALVGPLKEHGHEVLVADDSWEAIGFCGATTVDLVLIDLDWSGDDGLSGWEFIKGALAARPLLPIIIITRHTDLLDAAHEAGASGFAAKPVDVRTLLEVAGELLDGQSDPGDNGHVPRARHFEQIPAVGQTLRTAMRDRFQKPFVPDESCRHWGLNE